MSPLQHPSSFSRTNLNQLFNLDDNLIQSIDIKHTSTCVEVHITLNKTDMTCPVCETVSSKIKDYSKKKILHSLLTNYPCYIIYRARRYICPHCKKSFYENNPFSHQNMKISVLTVSNVLQDLKKATETFTSVANRYGLSSTTAASIFDSHVFISRKRLPNYLCIDECYAFSGDYGNYVCAFVDFESKDLVDLLPSRKKEDLVRYFDRIPLEERQQVKMISIDMWETYRIVARLKLPNCKVAVDKFHILQELHRKIKRIRTDLMNKVKPPKITKELKELATKEKEPKAIATLEEYILRDEQYYVFKKFDWLLFLNDENYKKNLDYNREKKWNRKLKRYCNYKDLLDLMLDQQPDLEIAYNYLHHFSQFYKNCEHKDAKEKLEILINKAFESDLLELIQFGEMIRKWKYEIINSFILVDEKTKRKMNNGVIEGRNKILKQLKHNSNGYRNWERYRNRAMYVINPDATYHLNPMEGR